jgi:peptide/nickel transport system substrate-binding protein
MAWTTRRAVLGVSLGAIALSRTSSAAAQSAPAGTLRIVAPFEIPSLEPTSGAGFVFLRLGVGETLVAMADEGAIEPGLAASWSHQGDGKVWRFRLRANARFHDGTPLTSDAVANALNRSRGTAQGLRLAGVASVVADGPDVVITTAEPVPVLPSLLTEAGTMVLAPASYDAEGKVRTVIGTGPYRVERIDGRLGVDAVRFDGYWGEKPTIERVRYLAVANPEARTNIALAGDADLVFNLAPAAIARVRAGGATVRTVNIPRTLYLILNLDKPQFADVEVRRALSLALDRQGMATSIMREPSAAADQIFSDGMPEWHIRRAAAPRDVGAAARLLEARGWRLGPDGIRVKDGVRLSFELVSYATRAEIPLGAQAAQAGLREVGVEARIVSADWTVVPERQRDGSLEASMMSRGYTLVADPIPLILADFTRDRSEWGAMNWRNDEFRAEARRYFSSFDATARAAARARMVAILDRELPVIPLFFTPLTVAVSPRLSGVTIDPYEMRYTIQRMRLS